MPFIDGQVTPLHFLHTEDGLYTFNHNKNVKLVPIIQILILTMCTSIHPLSITFVPLGIVGRLETTIHTHIHTYE